MTASRGIGRGGPAGEDHPRARLTVAKVQEMRRRAAADETYEQLAAWAGCSRETARDAVTGVTWAHVTDPPPVHRLRRWTADDLDQLAAGGPSAVVAAKLGRTPHAIDQQRSKARTLKEPSND